jgi:hypothetical protein
MNWRVLATTFLVGSVRICLIVLAITTAAETWAANTYNVVWDGTLYNQFDPGEAGDSPYESVQTLGSTSGQGMSLPNLTVDFSSDKTFQITVTGAGGQAIQVTPPLPPNTSSHQHQLIVSLSSFSTLNGEFISGSVDGFSFAGLQGASPTLGTGQFQYASSSFIGGNNPQFNAFVTLNLPGSISFTSLTLNFTGPPEMSFALNDVTPIAQLYVRSQGFFDSGVVSDPGPWVSLIAVPEPSGVILGLAGLMPMIGSLRRTRRALRRSGQR